MQQTIRTVYEYSRVATVLLLIVVLGVLNISFLVQVPEAEANNPAKISDLMTDTDLGVVSNHTISFITVATSTASSTITIDFPDAFRSTSTGPFANTDALDYDIATTSMIATNEIDIVAEGQCPGDGDDNLGITMYEITSISPAIVFTFTHCKDTPLIGNHVTTTIEIGYNATTGGAGDSRIVNPAQADAAGSQLITLTQDTDNGTDTGITRVFIIDDVVLTASIDTVFTFTISGVAGSQSRCTETTDEASTSTALPFGDMSADVAKVLAQDITVETNARSGHVTTIQQNQNPLSSTGADIDVFDDGTSQTTPATWSVPADIIDQEETYGHYGYTTQDSDLNGGEFTGGGQKYAGFDGINTPDVIFSHYGPADGAEADKGATTVCYQMEVTALQEAANDYTNEITYISTPTF